MPPRKCCVFCVAHLCGLHYVPISQHWSTMVAQKANCKKCSGVAVGPRPKQEALGINPGSLGSEWSELKEAEPVFPVRFPIEARCHTHTENLGRCGLGLRLPEPHTRPPQTTSLLLVCDLNAVRMGAAINEW